MLTKNAYKKLIERLASRDFSDEELSDIIDPLAGHFSETAEILARHGTVIDDEETDSYEYTETVSADENFDTSQYVPVDKYNELRSQYISRFFGDIEGENATPDEAKENNVEDTKRDGEVVTYDDLFIESEGDNENA